MKKDNNLFAVINLTILLAVFVFNIFVLPKIVAHEKNVENADLACNHFCSSSKAADYSTKYNADKGSFSCSCMNGKGTIIAKTFFGNKY